MCAQKGLIIVLYTVGGYHMKCSRGLRIVFGVIFLVIFAAYFVMRFNVSPRTRDFDSDHAFVYSEVQAVLDSGMSLEEYFKDDPRYGHLAGQAAAEEQQAESTPEPTPEVTPEPTPEPGSPEAKAAELGLPAPPDIDITSWEYVLVNGDHSIGQYEPAQLAYLNQTASETDIQHTTRTAALWMSASHRCCSTWQRAARMRDCRCFCPPATAAIPNRPQTSSACARITACPTARIPTGTISRCPPDAVSTRPALAAI